MYATQPKTSQLSLQSLHMGVLCSRVLSTLLSLQKQFSSIAVHVMII